MDLLHKDLSYTIQGIAFDVRLLVFVSMLLVLFSGLSPQTADAQSLILSTPKTGYRIGDNFPVTLSINTGGQAVNTLSGTLDIPLDKVTFTDVRYGSSIVTLWVNRPIFDSQKGMITFAGGIPGGFSGSNGPVLTLYLKARRSGEARITLSEFKVLLNDGQGTELSGVTARPLILRIAEVPPPEKIPEKKEVPVEEAEETFPPPDTVPPEPFLPLISRHPSVGDNKYFVSFFAVDKDTGVSYYEIYERPRTVTRITAKFDKKWVSAESPYVLKIQWWPSEISIRAYDQAGNYIEGTARKPIHPALLWIIIGIAAVAIFTGIKYNPLNYANKRFKH